jgi:type I restriction enzyme S subunit
MREGWKKYKLGDLIDIKHGYAFKGEFFSDQTTNDILLTPGNFKIGGGFKNDKFKYYKGDYPEDYILKVGDIIVTMTDLSKEGDTLGYSAIVPDDAPNKFLHNQRIGLIQFKNEEIDKHFVYWLLRTKTYQTFIVNSATGSTVKHTSPTRIQEYEFEAPDLSTQRRAAAILSALDEKIELNRQTNQTLEAIAQAMFKEWFVDINFPGATGEMQESELGPIPMGWKVEKIKALAKKIQYGLTQSASANEVGPRFLRITDIQNGVIDWSSVPFCVVKDKDHEKYGIKKYDIFIARTGASTGENALVVNPPKAVFASYLIRIQFARPELALYVAKFLRTNKYSEFIDGIKSGSAQPNANAQELTDQEIVVPSDGLLKDYFQIVSIFEEIKSENQYQNQALTQIRDNLLPKLISGEIDV